MAGSLPFLLAGPISRRLTETELVLWYVTSTPAPVAPSIQLEDGTDWIQPQLRVNTDTFPVGQHAFIHVMEIAFPGPLPAGTLLHFDLHFELESGRQSIAQLAPHLLYPGKTRPNLRFQPKIKRLLHGSCRKPHHCEPDSLKRVDDLIQDSLQDVEKRPELLIMSGDQVYVDDVAGPMLKAIHDVVELLGLIDEEIPGATVSNARELYQHPDGFYNRTQLLPDSEENEEVEKRFFLAKRKPIFTSVNAQNHLITAAEVIAMYLLVWSPVLWRQLKLIPPQFDPKHHAQYQEESEVLQEFCDSLPQVSRALAHIPCYMIFDDHDITDDWNLTRGWEEAAYGNPFSKRIIGNALLAYYLCQGLGNDPQRLAPLTNAIKSNFNTGGLLNQDQVLKALFDWGHWHYQLPTTPMTMVLDTRTHRWRSESKPNQPSGLMDWESLQAMKQDLEGKDAVILVSAAPMFGVKLIETVQRIFTYFGQALTVDAENWMAHPGTAKVLLDTFKDPKTPKDFVILSGDVHYSFCYDVRLRFTKDSPRIQQITASGIKNQFPIKLIRLFDTWNRWLYGPRSPLVWFTKRRRMKIRARYPNRKDKCTSLVSKSAIGLVEWSSRRRKPKVKILCHDGTDITFR